jgi:hypothetical protein
MAGLEVPKEFFICSGRRTKAICPKKTRIWQYSIPNAYNHYTTIHSPTIFG